MDQANKKLELESIAADMFSSSCPEELLRIFLTRLGETLSVDRVFIYHFTNQLEGKILVEAISSDVDSIKDHIYPIAYFGAASLQDYPRDRVVISSNIASKYRQRGQVKTMMSGPILIDRSTLADNFWGLAIVQRCHHARNWQPREAEFFFEITQVLSHCLQYWELRLRSHSFSQPALSARSTNDKITESDREEFLAKRIDLSQDLEPASLLNPTLEEMQVPCNFILADEENEIFNRVHIKNIETSIDLAVNRAMQRLDSKTKSNLQDFT